MQRHIGILDYGMGNISSVCNALEFLGYESQIVSSTEEIKTCSHLIIPGVGAYDTAMSNIHQLGVFSAITEYAQSGRPLLGICLGMQILSTHGQEGSGAKGLNLISGEVNLLDLQALPVPHVGWNSLEIKFEHVLFKNIKKHVDFYFVHSYFFNIDNINNILAITEYGKQFPAIIVNNNVIGVQFHPEKSQDNGLLLIENFCEWDGVC